MTAYAIANLHNPAPHPEVAEYIESIQATLDPYGGRFLVHGARHEVKVLSEGFGYQGEVFASLSALAQHITGAKRSGHAFFGLKG